MLGAMDAATLFRTKVGIGLAAMLWCILPFWAYRATAFPFDTPLFPMQLWTPLRISVIVSSLLLAYAYVAISRFLIPIALAYLALAGVFFSEHMSRSEWRYVDLAAGWMLLIGGVLVLSEAIYSRARTGRQ